MLRHRDYPAELGVPIFETEDISHAVSANVRLTVKSHEERIYSDQSARYVILITQ